MLQATEVKSLEFSGISSKISLIPKIRRQKRSTNVISSIRVIRSLFQDGETELAQLAFQVFFFAVSVLVAKGVELW